MLESVVPIRGIASGSHTSVRSDRPLYTATLRLIERDGSILEVFHACRAGSRAEAVARLGARIGAAAAAASHVWKGVDVRDPIVVALLGTVMAGELSTAGDLHGAPLLGDGDLNIVQRRG